MENKLKQMVILASDAIKNCKTINELMDVKALYLGKKSEFNTIMQDLKGLSDEEKPRIGKMVNEAKQAISALIEEQKNRIDRDKIDALLKEQTIDITLPGKKIAIGHKHILTKTIEEIEDIFVGLGYTIKEGPEVESDKYNFEMLNLPKDHPAREMQDSFYITEETLLRTHTSPVQVRSLLANTNQEPLKIICPGVVYRKDDDDQTHSHQFMQIEALVVDEKATLADLKGTLLLVAKKLFGENREIRLRPSYFPFTEPSVEVDVSCFKCNGVGCSMCKQTGWIEILGAGMVNNNVLKAAGYDTDKYQGFALGMGIERIAMLKYGIEDIRHLYTNDLRFNSQF
ncbi:MAG: phenylalanine--tRNA ligase subunit alpha [Candidatus Izemoplasmatales bacterium]|jgi:phenylalanyl-tRNA synthetase alpha chain|nr:phenylalanine--tRNA ligase subunit alpha [Candidatus Izemoplasmatales bacterium]